MANISNTQYFKVNTDPEYRVKEILDTVYDAMAEKGYNPVNQIVGYIMSGDPTYITSYKNGVAVSDGLGITAQGVEIIRRTQENKLRKTLARIEELIAEYDVGILVLGYPKNMNNTVGDRAEKSLEFQKMLEKRTGLPVVMWDERLTTVEAHRTMMESGVRREDRKKYVDKLAAVYILQGYLDHEGMKRERTQPE